MEQASTHAANTDVTASYNKLMASTVKYKGKEVTVKDALRCYGVRKNEFSAFFSRVNVFLSKGIWLDKTTIKKGDLQNINEYRTFNEKASGLSNSKYKTISTEMQNIFQNANKKSLALGVEDVLNKKKLIEGDKDDSPDEKYEENSDSTTASETESSEGESDVTLTDSQHSNTPAMPKERAVFQPKKPKLKEKEPVKREDAEVIAKQAEQIEKDTQLRLDELKKVEEEHTQKIDEATKIVSDKLTAVIAKEATRDTGKVIQAFGTRILTSEVRPVIDMALKNFNKFCLTHLTSENQGRRVFESIAPEHHADLQELYDIRKKLKALENNSSIATTDEEIAQLQKKEKHLLNKIEPVKNLLNDLQELYSIRKEMKSLQAEQSTITSKLSSIFFTPTETNARFAELQAREQELLTKLEPVSKVLKTDKVAPLYPALKNEIAHVLNLHIKALAAAHATVKGAYPYYEYYPKNYRDYLIAEATRNAMVTLDIPNSKLVVVPHLLHEERDVYDNFAKEKANYLKLKAKIEAHQGGSSELKVLEEARDQSFGKCEDMISQIDKMEKKLAEELAEGNREDEAKFMEKHVSNLIVETILFPDGLQLGKTRAKLAGKALGEMPEEFLKKMVANQIVSMLVDNLSDPKQIHSLTDSLIATQAKTARKLNRKNEARSAGESQLRDLSLRLEQDEKALTSLNIQYTAHQKKMSAWQARNSDLRGEVGKKEQEIRSALSEEVKSLEKQIQGLEAELAADRAEQNNIVNPGWVSWGISGVTYLTSTVEEVEQVEQEKDKELTRLTLNIDRLPVEIASLQQQIEQAESKVENRIEALQDEVKANLAEEKRKLDEELKTLDEQKAQLEKNMKGLQQEKASVERKQEKIGGRIEELSGTAVTDQMLIDELLDVPSSDWAKKKDAEDPSVVQVRKDIHEMASSLMQIAAPKSGKVAEKVTGALGYDAVIIANIEQSLTALIDQFALKADESVLEAGYEKLTNLLNNQQPTPQPTQQAQTNASKGKQKVRKEVENIVEYNMGKKATYVLGDHVVSSVMAGYAIVDNPALNRLLACQLLGGVARAINEVVS